ncbi:anhydro-N-acetylmuramic acid kinase [Hufsiella ginkgonis]|uniref:Anhydro-N-acetylmuramic acid kinase n=1 Tax=Hufsiella ginkgonis TaxID=2695274 RepID=A0A7K1XV26_9SPHI|nr:anhydro-N-acetylmuramic acid kinase [Hufsiella ginkgonis]MXV14648.1 anhydro-N-acetylmuramic acid kinase [Hufsiella ginkgonis]
MALSDIRKLLAIAEKPSRLVIGLMSGTSLDGLDIALCRISGSGARTRAEVLRFETTPYPKSFKEDVLGIFARSQGDTEKLTLLNEVIGSTHAGYILAALAKWNVDPPAVDCIASHGQTIYHAPKRLHQQENYPNATLQIGDGDHIAVKTGIITLCDFRQKHIAAGGEGAPLALYGDKLLFSSAKESRVLLNMGGIANFTFLPQGGNGPVILSTDTGPGNTLIDAATRNYYQQDYDAGGRLAASGKADEELLAALLSHTFFEEALPKTTGPELFGETYLAAALEKAGRRSIAPQDLLATLSRLTAVSIANAIKKVTGPGAAVYVSGGGCHNPVVMNAIKEALPGFAIHNFAKLGIDPDAKEALLFAVLANETLAGDPGIDEITMGKICLPR